VSLKKTTFIFLILIKTKISLKKNIVPNFRTLTIKRAERRARRLFAS